MLVYDRGMHRHGFLHRLRSALAALFGISSEEAGNGEWWEIDLALVVVAGAFVLGAIAWTKL